MSKEKENIQEVFPLTALYWFYKQIRDTKGGGTGGGSGGGGGYGYGDYGGGGGMSESDEDELSEYESADDSENDDELLLGDFVRNEVKEILRSRTIYNNKK